MYRNELPETLALTGGDKLRNIRIQRGLTQGDVCHQAKALASSRNNEELALSISSLSDFETKDRVPSVEKLYSLSLIYELDLLNILSWYGLGPKNH